MRTVPVIAVLLCASIVGAQPLPDIGKLMMRSNDRKYIETGCVLCFDKKDEHFECCDNGADTNWKYWDAAEFWTEAGTPLDCTTEPCCLPLTPGQMAQVDWIMPSYDAVTTSVLVSSRPSISTAVGWATDWCSYADGEQPCSPDLSNVQNTTATSTVDWRADANFPDFAETWCPGDHVVLNTWGSTETCLDGIRWEHVPARTPKGACNATRTPTPTHRLPQCATFTPTRTPTVTP